MHRFTDWLHRKTSDFMMGRYGQDELSRFLSIVSLVCLVMFFFSKVQILYIMAFVLLIYSLFRIMSKHHDKRRAERNVYISARNAIKKEFGYVKNKWTHRKTHRYYKCPRCKQALRVPKGRGSITISCPKCKNQFDKKT